MVALLAVLIILALLLGGFGFAVHVLWWVAVAVAVVALVLFVVRRA